MCGNGVEIVDGRRDMSITPIEKMLESIDFKPVENTPSGDLPYVTHEGMLKIGEIEVRVYQLNDGQRIIQKEDFERLFGATMEEILGGQPHT